MFVQPQSVTSYAKCRGRDLSPSMQTSAGDSSCSNSDNWSSDGEDEGTHTPPLQLNAKDDKPCSPALQITIAVKNTFVDVRWNIRDEDKAEETHPRRRAVSLPPLDHTVTLPLEDIVTPESTPRHRHSAPECMISALKGAEEMSVPQSASQPVLGGSSIFVPISLSQMVSPASVMPQAPIAQQSIEHLKAAGALLEEAHRTELAAAALWAQNRLEAAQNEAAAAKKDRKIRMQQKKTSRAQSQALPTSVMLRNLPLDMTRNMFLAMLDMEGFAGKYDLIYLPRDFCTSANLGYAFVNLLTHDEAINMQDHFSGFCWQNFRSAKKCEAAWCSTQGRAAYIDRYRNNPVMHESVPDDFKPALFRKGVQIAFPAPTRRLKSPYEYM